MRIETPDAIEVCAIEPSKQHLGDGDEENCDASGAIAAHRQPEVLPQCVVGIAELGELYPLLEHQYEKQQRDEALGEDKRRVEQVHGGDNHDILEEVDRAAELLRDRRQRFGSECKRSKLQGGKKHH